MIKKVHFVDKPFEHVLKCSPYSDDPAGKNRRSWEELMHAHIIGKHLNDMHRWTREEVSEWVETMEPSICGCGCEMEPSVRAINREQV